MKKYLFFVAVATLFAVSCQKENGLISEQNKNNNALTFKASIEQLVENAQSQNPSQVPVKGTIDESNQLVWAENDLIGIYFPDWGDKNQPFRLAAEDAGKTVGSFSIATAANPSGASATAAYFPWEPAGSTTYPESWQNNVYEGVMYFKLRDTYHDYSTKKMLTPMVASITSSTDNISFKHAGAAVKLVTNNLVSGEYYAKMTVADKQITGGFHVNPANAGSEALALDAAEDKAQNNVTLHAWKSSGSFTWIFPVPEISKPKLKFEITDKYGVTVWKKSLAAQSNDLGRGDILVMPDKDINAYEGLTKDATTWTFSGNINGSAWIDNIPMYTDGNYSVLSGCTFAAGDEFKIRKDNKWDEAYPGSNWVFNAGNAGTKDIIFNNSTHEIRVVDHTFPYPAVDLSDLASAITIDGNMSDWTFHNSLASTGTSRVRSWKFTSDADNLYFYLVLRKNKCRTAYKLTLALKWNESGTYSGDNLSNANALVVFQPFTNSDNTDGTKPTCVDGTISSATVNGVDTTVSISAYGSNPDTSANGESADYYLEFSIPKADIPSLPASGSISIGAGYEWYNTSYQSVTL